MDSSKGPESLDFRRLTGHRDARESLVEGGRTQPFPSLVFSGPLGTGKRLVGIWYAAYLNCFSQDHESTGPCGECGSCRKILSGNHPDLHIASVPEQKTVLGVSEIREAIHQLGYAPFEGRFKILILESGEKLTDEAQNALLKTLEEPPRAAIILLITPLFGALIPTVVSRCRLVRFQGLSPGMVENHLRDLGADDGQAAQLAKLSGGSIGLAVNLMQNPKDLVAREEAVGLFLGLPGRDMWGATDTAMKLEKLKNFSLEALLDLGISAFRDLLVVTTGSPGLVSHEGRLSELQRLAQSVTPSAARGLLRLFQEAQHHRHSNVSPKLVLQRLCYGLTQGAS